MSRFRKKPVVIEAEQWFPDKEIEGVTQFTISPGIAAAGGCKPGTRAMIDTLEGPMTVSPGDWVITGVEGEKYPCKPHIFAKTYEPVEADA